MSAFNRGDRDSEKGYASICAGMGKRMFPVMIPEKTDISRLPYGAWTEEELVRVAGDGDGAACMELVLRALDSRNEDNLHHWETPWALYMLADKWLAKAVALKQPGALFVKELIFGKHNGELNYREMAGYEEFMSAVVQGDAVLCRIGFYCDEAYDPDRKWSRELLKEMERKADAGEEAAQALYAKLPMLAREGDEGWEDQLGRKAKWLESQAERGDLDAMYEWLMLCPRPRLKPDDIDRFFRYYVKLINTGYAATNENLLWAGFPFPCREFNLLAATFPETDFGTLYDWGQKKALERGSALVMKRFHLMTDPQDSAIVQQRQNAFRLLNLGFYNVFYTINPEEASAMMLNVQPLAQQGNPAILYMLAKAYESEYGNIVIQDNKKALELFQKALVPLVPLSGNRLFRIDRMIDEIKVEILRCRLRLAEDDAEWEDIFTTCMALYERSTDKKSETFMRLCGLLGYMHETGRGTSRDYRKAVMFYEQDACFEASRNALGELYEAGLGVEKDIEKAVRLYVEAADEGYPPAKENLKRLGRDSYGSPIVE